MNKKSEAISASDFCARFERALGPDWRDRLSGAIEVNTTTIWRWTTGATPVPEYVVAILEFIEALPKAFRPKRWVE